MGPDAVAIGPVVGCCTWAQMETRAGSFVRLVVWLLWVLLLLLLLLLSPQDLQLGPQLELFVDSQGSVKLVDSLINWFSLKKSDFCLASFGATLPTGLHTKYSWKACTSSTETYVSTSTNIRCFVLCEDTLLEEANH